MKYALLVLTYATVLSSAPFAAAQKSATVPLQPPPPPPAAPKPDDDETGDPEVDGLVRNEDPRGLRGDPFSGPGGISGSFYSFRSLLQFRYMQTFTRTEDGVVRAARRYRRDIAEEQARQFIDSPIYEGTRQDLLNAARRAADQDVTFFEREARENDGARLNRVFLRTIVQPTEQLRFRLLLDFAELIRGNTRRTLKLAFGELELHDRVLLTAGLFKIPFSLLELLPIAEWELAEVGPIDSFIKDQGFAGRDVGVMLDIAPLQKKRWLHLFLGAFQNEAVGPQEGRGPGMFAARAVTRPIKRLRIGIDAAWRPTPVYDYWVDYRVTDAQNERYMILDKGAAYTADVQFKYKKFDFRGEVLYGDRTQADRPPIGGGGQRPLRARIRRGDARTFAGAWGLATYRVPFMGMTLIPAARAEWMDTSLEEDTGIRKYYSAAVNLDVNQFVRFVVDVSHMDVQPGTLSLSRAAPFPFLDVDATIVVAQLQLKL
jgi:hypothetical protein